MRKSLASDAISDVLASHFKKFSAGTRSASWGEQGENPHLLANLGDANGVSSGRQEASAAFFSGTKQQWTCQKSWLVCPRPTLEGKDALQAVRDRCARRVTSLRKNKPVGPQTNQGIQNPRGKPVCSQGALKSPRRPVPICQAKN